MYENMRVKYLFINLRYPTYIKIAVFCFVILSVAALLCFIFLRTHSLWYLRYLWLFFVIGLPLGILETVIAVRKAKKEYHMEKRMADGDNARDK